MPFTMLTRQRPIHLALPVVLAALAFGTRAVPAQDSQMEQIERVARDYGDGWYEGDAERMESALHPELAKRMVFTDQRTGRSSINQMGAMTLVDATRRGGGVGVEGARTASRIVILDVYEKAASVRVEGPQWVDYLHMAKWNGEWKIVNVLWELHPTKG